VFTSVPIGALLTKQREIEIEIERERESKKDRACIQQ
jgi:hypothetical protein